MINQAEVMYNGIRMYQQNEIMRPPSTASSGKPIKLPKKKKLKLDGFILKQLPRHGLQSVRREGKGDAISVISNFEQRSEIQGPDLQSSRLVNDYTQNEPQMMRN